MKAMVVIVLVVCVGVCVAARQLTIGHAAPEISAAEWINASGPVSLLQQRGTVVVVCFFSTVNERSVRAVFEMKRWQQHFAKKGVAFVALTDQDRAKGEVNRFVTRHKITFPVGTGSPARNQYFVAKGSYAFVVDRAGTLVWKGEPEQGLQAAIELALNRSRGEMTATNVARKVNARMPEN
jgi:peroxiredoxin